MRKTVKGPAFTGAIRPSGLPFRDMARLLLATLSLSVSCQAVADSAFDAYAGFNTATYLNTADKKALSDLSGIEKSRGRQGTVQGVVARPGEVLFTYGASRPNIVCAVLELTDIALEPGESVTAVQLGDSARWFVDAAVSGNGESAVQHLIVKPLDAGLKTSLIITTDRRSYHLALKSTLKEFMPMVRFNYPGAALSKLRHLNSLKAQYTAERTLEGTSVTVDALCFDYALSGDPSLMPKRVFNDGRKTFVELPDKLPSGRLPVLVIVHDTSLLGKDKTSLANYRYQGRRIVVDSLFDRAKLILTEGDDAREVLIERQEEAA